MTKIDINFLCLDDEKDIESACRRLEVSGLKIQLERPNSDWSLQVDQIDTELKSGAFKGLLIDFRLDETHHGSASVDEQGKRVRYTAESLITELRRRSIEGGKDESYPIILWSTAAFLKGFYELNPAYSVAYDDIWDKSQLPDRNREYGAKLLGLSMGYDDISAKLALGKSTMADLLNADSNSSLREFEQSLSKKTRGSSHVFQYALFITHDILEVSGPLIDIDLLYSFLGISPLNNDDQLHLVAFFDDCRYTGVFASSYLRFWRNKVLARLEQLTDVSSWLSLTAKERLELLCPVIPALKLTAAEPIVAHYGTDYDCVCSLLNRPLAKRDAFKLIETRTLPWKEPEYVSGIAYRRRFNDLVRSRPLEAEDYDRFCQIFEVQ